jgi:hypothetical protein
MVRLLLILLIVFLIARLFIVYGTNGPSVKKDLEPEEKDKKSRNGIPKGVGEYVEYEEVKKRK